MLMEGRNYGISDMLKTVYPTKTLFYGGYKYSPSSLYNQTGADWKICPRK